MTFKIGDRAKLGEYEGTVTRILMERDRQPELHQIVSFQPDIEEYTMHIPSRFLDPVLPNLPLKATKEEIRRHSVEFLKQVNAEHVRGLEELLSIVDNNKEAFTTYRKIPIENPTFKMGERVLIESIIEKGKDDDEEYLMGVSHFRIRVNKSLIRKWIDR